MVSGIANLALLPCSLLPPGELNDIIPEPLVICHESFNVIAATVSRNVAMITNFVTTRQTRLKTTQLTGAVAGRRITEFRNSELNKLWNFV